MKSNPLLGLCESMCSNKHFEKRWHMSVTDSVKNKKISSTNCQQYDKSVRKRAIYTELIISNTLPTRTDSITKILCIEALHLWSTTNHF